MTVEKPFKWAILGDTQIPYQDDRAIALFYKAMKWWKPDAVDVVGDVDDLLEFSRFSDGTTDEFYNKLKKLKKEEGEADEVFLERISPVPYALELTKPAKNFYTNLRKAFPNADIEVRMGNHDIRLKKYFDKKFPEYLDEIEYDKVYDLHNLGISWTDYHEAPKERFAGIHTHHGNTVSSSGAAVRGDIEKYNISLARGHDHLGGVFYKNYPLSKTHLVGIATGHLCDPNQYGLQYTMNPDWDLGFAVVRIQDGFPQPEFIRISPNYTLVLDGKVFKG